MNRIKPYVFLLLYSLPGFWFSFRKNGSIGDEVLAIVISALIVNAVSFLFTHAWQTFVKVQGEDSSHAEGYLNIILFCVVGVTISTIVVLVNSNLWFYFFGYCIGVTCLRIANET
ncbi:hypothetical protein KBA63_01380 [Candidatus Woesebacteria bacterium]|jgi:hypothetical protein|nr:hypothetical protein [Candidatus Woesebacteria bacterium]MBP9687396.1 hypothetical protein [Candidatus Woesebacteria bacterium]